MSLTQRLRDSGNLLLDRLPSDEFEALEPKLQRVSFTLKQVVHEFDREIEHVYFPLGALVSLLTVLEEDDPVEAATVGREGFVGMAVALGVVNSPHRSICQMPGDSFRLSARSFQEAMRRGPATSRLIHRYCAFLMQSTAQGIACNALHTIDARACRWLLISHDQAARDEFPMTQEFWASMLGVRRQSVTVVAGAIQNAGMIEFRRGVITVLDRPRLEEAACECYASVRNYYDRTVC